MLIRPFHYAVMMFAAGIFCLAPAAQKVTTIKVTTIVHDYDTAVLPNQLLMRSDDYLGYQQAAYTDTSNPAGTGGVQSHIWLDGGSWQMYLGNQSFRTLWLTLSHPVGNSPPAPAPDGYYYANVEVYSNCFDANNQPIGLLVIPPGMSNNRCNLGYDFSYAGVKYKLVMSPLNPGTGWATVSCTAADSSGSCKSWTIAPYTGADNPNPTVANLYKFTNRGLVYLGQYYNTYRIDVTNP